MQFAPGSHSRTGRLRFRRHGRQGINPKFPASRRGVIKSRSRFLKIPSFVCASLFFPPVDVAQTHIAVDVTIHRDERTRAGEQVACRRVHDAQFAITEVVIDKPADVGQSLGPPRRCRRRRHGDH
jgi:hypothetical protein